MAQTKPAQEGLLLDGKINPKTGRVWTLADPEVRVKLDADLRAMRSNPSKALEFLKGVGIMTSSGKLSKKYGGA